MTEIIQNTSHQTTNAVSAEKAASERSLTQMVYILQALGFLIGITFIAAIIVNLIKKGDMQSELAKSHMSWQLRTGLWSFAGCVIGGMTMMLIVGYFIVIGAVIWTIYRVVRGWLALSDNKPI